jgi:dimeric dUTPase (all-alpha-NTP-PPase superfamily)
MDLKKLFETQKILRDRISYNESDRFEKLILALLVELGECANEQRSWKFWSQDQEPRTFKWFGICEKCNGFGVDDENYRCMDCAGTGDGYKNPLLEEYVDGLHFVLELGIEKEYEIKTHITKVKCETIAEQFNKLFEKIVDFNDLPTIPNYLWIIDLFIGLGEMLGFTWEEIEQAYFAKNKINHMRQDVGY